MARRQQWIVLFCSCLLAFSGNFFSQILSPLSRRLQGQSSACTVISNFNADSTVVAAIVNATDPSAYKKPDHCLNLDSTEYNSLSATFTYATAIAAVFAALAVKHSGQRWLIWSSGLLAVTGA